MQFKDKIPTKVLRFKDDWVRSRILAPNVFDDLNRQGALLCLALIETGCRPSELANIKPENIKLNAEVPHIPIRPTKDRELKSSASVRDIPLVGVALEAMWQAPNGFPHYRDRSYLLVSSQVEAVLRKIGLKAAVILKDRLFCKRVGLSLLYFRLLTKGST